ncbi:Sugar transporter ERD6-like 5 [Linum perenne]
MGQLDYRRLETGLLRQPNDVAVTALVAVFGSMATGCAYGYSSPAESGVMAEMGMSVAQYSTFGSIMTIGGMLGSLVNGKMADLIGRRYTMWVSEVFFVASWFIIAFAKVPWLLDLGRFIMGFAVAITAYVVPVYIAEITPKNIRGTLTSTHQFMITFGFSIAYLAGTVISWRALALVGAVPCLLQVFGIFFIPESPRWLAKVGRDKELEETLKYLREKGCDVSQEALDIKDHTKLLEGLSENSVFDLFQQKYANALVVVSGLMVLQEFGGTNAIAYYAASICDMAGVSSTIGTVSIAIIQIPATVTSVLLTDKLGRRPLLLISSFGLFLSTFLLGLAFMFQDLHSSGTVTGLLAYIGLMGLPISFSLGMAGLPSVVMSEVFPINIKGTAGSLVTFLNWSSSFIVTYSFNFVVLWNSAGTFFIFSGIWVLGIMFIGKFVPETKGKTLEELTHIVSEEEEEEEG